MQTRVANISANAMKFLIKIKIKIYFFLLCKKALTKLFYSLVRIIVNQQHFLYRMLNQIQRKKVIQLLVS